MNGNDELAQMERTFNEMMGQLEQNFMKQEQFVSNASHELKTPLTVIESYARLLERRGFDNREVVDEALAAIISETGRMKEMIAQMLDLAKSSGFQAFEFEEVDLKPLLEGAVKPLKQAYGREIIIEAEGPVIVETDGKFVKQLLFILLDNARKYSDREIYTSIEERQDRSGNHCEGLWERNPAIGFATYFRPFLSRGIRSKQKDGRNRFRAFNREGNCRWTGRNIND